MRYFNCYYLLISLDTRLCILHRATKVAGLDGQWQLQQSQTPVVVADGCLGLYISLHEGAPV